MNKSKDNDQTFVIKILDDLRSNNNRTKPSAMRYDTSMMSSNDSLLLSNKRRRSCSPDLQESILSVFEHSNNKNILLLIKMLYFQHL